LNNYLDAFNTRLTKLKKINIIINYKYHYYSYIIVRNNIFKTPKCPGNYELMHAQLIARPH